MEEGRKRSARVRPATLALDDMSHEVLVALRRIIRAVDLQSKRINKLSGLTTPQILILRAIATLGEVTSGRLSDHVTLSQATVTTILDRLESRGLIERYRSTVDKRIVHARLTTAGRRSLKKAPPLLHERFVEDFSQLDPPTQRSMVATLEQVAVMLGGSTLDAAPVLDVSVPGGAEGPVTTKVPQ